MENVWKNNPTIALNILHIKEKEICPAHILEIDSNCEKQRILWMIPKEGKVGWHYPAVKKTMYIIKKKKATINSKNADDKCFQYAATVGLNYEEIESRPERVSNIKLFINKYN